MNKPLVSIVIPTWQRIEECETTIVHIRSEQTYKNLEIIVICDGQDPLLLEHLTEQYYLQHEDIEFKPEGDIKFVQLGRNWSGLDPSSFGIAPLLVGYLMARGRYVMPWCDDERALIPDHIEKMVQAMETPIGNDNHGKLVFPDFAYPRVHIWRHNNPNNHENTIIGTAPPVHGQITHYIFRPENFIKFGYPDWNSHPVDWSLVDKWQKAGAIGAMIPEVTFEHRLDR